MFERVGVGRGMGFGFRGSSPPPPDTGRGRGGLPRCHYFSGRGISPAWPGAYPRETFTPEKMNRERETDFWKNQAEAMKNELEQIEARIRELESGEER